MTEQSECRQPHSQSSSVIIECSDTRQANRELLYHHRAWPQAPGWYRVAQFAGIVCIGLGTRQVCRYKILYCTYPDLPHLADALYCELSLSLQRRGLALNVFFTPGYRPILSGPYFCFFYCKILNKQCCENYAINLPVPALSLCD